MRCFRDRRSWWIWLCLARMKDLLSYQTPQKVLVHLDSGTVAMEVGIR